MSRATQIYVDDAGRVTQAVEAKLADPHAPEPGEVIFGMDGINPIRKPSGWRLINGEIPVPWKYCKVSGGEIVEMNQAEKDQRDAELAQEEDAAKDLQASSEGAQAIVKALVKVINLRLPEGQRITAEEMKAAIKAEL